MPLLIDEVIAEVDDGVTAVEERMPAEQQTNLSNQEKEITRQLALIQERQARLKID